MLCAKESKWNDATAQASLGMCLTGSARSWFRGVEQEIEFVYANPVTLNPKRMEEKILENVLRHSG